MTKFIFKVRVSDAAVLFNILPANKLLTYDLPANVEGLVDATFTSTIGMEEIKKLMHQVPNGAAMMESLKISYD
jgi:hypothetical protein